ncbi:MAG: HAD family phosphatase [Deltaproteobacteria bacterium]|nr:HAD family phosphatase [Deltaproteobacteria bacterium]
MQSSNDEITKPLHLAGGLQVVTPTPQIFALSDFTGSILIARQPRRCCWDFDGSQVATEHIHARFQRLALERRIRQRLHEPEWRTLGSCFGGQEILAFRQVLHRIRHQQDNLPPELIALFEGVEPEELVALKKQILSEHLEELARTGESGDFEVVDGFLPLMAHLHALGFESTTVTNTDSTNLGHFFKIFGLDSFHAHRVTGDQIPPGYGKPHGKPFRMACEKMGADLPGLCFENTAEGVISAWRAGGRVLLCATDRRLSTELSRLADMIEQGAHLSRDADGMKKRTYFEIIYMPAESWMPLVERLRVEHPIPDADPDTVTAGASA